ncbi:MAG: DUF4974 domain-containing protein [Bacteroidales bacterium]|jgi:ferric-dicitrate binding protein FerR (iron transport regulator)|nr:DUF4974 domain-containing protein [Bacteroidales bacterium]
MREQDNASIDDLILKCLNSNPSDHDLNELEAWLKSDPDNQKHFQQVKNIWESGAGLNVSTEAALTKVLRKIDHRGRFYQAVFYFSRLAAILFIPLLLGTIWLGYHYNAYQSLTGNIEVSAAFGTYSHIQLPDGTAVWLNSGSTLTYPERFTGSERKVQLSGEAYFEVHSDENKPFFVNTSSFIVKATGTRFNVMAYADCDQHTVALAEGKVSITGTDGSTGMNTTLKPDQIYMLDLRNGKTRVDNEDVYKYFAWKDGKLVFRNDMLSEVFRRIEKQYNVDIEIKGESLKQYRYRATFENETLDELLKLLSISSPLKYQVFEATHKPDGTFSRKRIVVTPNNAFIHK